MVKTVNLNFSTNGNTHIVDITNNVQGAVAQSRLRNGTVTVFAVGSTAGVTTVEFEPGLVEKDLPALFEKLAPYGIPYAHDGTWGDDNGASHLRASLLGSSLVVPFVDGQLTVGTWQQIIYIDFDTRPRKRRVVLQMMGE